MMNNFSYAKAGSLAEALKALSTKGAKLHAGGTDLLGCVRDGIIPVEKVVSISGLKELKAIAARPDGGLKIGALATLAEIAANPSVSSKYPVLAQAAAAVGTPQIREQGTIGGNLCQRPRCWYFRSSLQCMKKGGTTCYAQNGENQYHAIFGGGPCFFVHPSDVAVALSSLKAQLLVAGVAGNKAVKIETFFSAPKTIDKENALLPGEIVSEIYLPPLVGKVRSSYRKVRTRGSWDFALASIAVVLQLEGDVVASASLVLGGVGPYPWRIAAAEKLLTGKKLDPAAISSVAEASVAGAAALRDNAYKLAMVKGVVEESLAALAG
jgi:xanthine dehydrogenase YagS FAD-binding subunit